MPKQTKNDASQETNKQIFDAITLIADQRNIPRDTVIDSLKDAIIKSYIKEYPESELEVIIDYDNKHMEINQLFKVVDDNPELNDYAEISVKDAQAIAKSLKAGDTYKKPVSLADLSKLSLRMHLAQLLKHNVTSQSNKQIFTA
jgi:N utilization substance protein A